MSERGLGPPTCEELVNWVVKSLRRIPEGDIAPEKAFAVHRNLLYALHCLPEMPRMPKDLIQPSLDYIDDRLMSISESRDPDHAPFICDDVAEFGAVLSMLKKLAPPIDWPRIDALGNLAGDIQTRLKFEAGRWVSLL